MLLYVPLVSEIFTAIIEIFLLLVTGIYQIAVLGFRVFLILANGELLDSSEYALVVENMYAVMGVVMLFVIAFTLLKMMINGEEEKSATTIKKMIINLVTSVALIAVLPTIFGFAFDFQKSVLDHGTLGLFFGYGQYKDEITDDDNAVQQVKNGANMIVNSVFLAFFDVSEGYVKWAIENKDAYGTKCVLPVESQEIWEECRKASKANYAVLGGDHYGESFYDRVQAVNNGASFLSYAGFAGRVVAGDIDFNILMAIVGGALLVYVSVIYCFDMGKRLVKLIFFQLIAPIPIMLRVVPDGKLSGVFKEWYQITLACYLEVFIRVFVLYAVVFMCVKINDSVFINRYLWRFGLLEAILTKVFIFAGLVMFMKEAPKLISKITGIDSGNMSFSLKDRLAESGLFTAGAAIGAGTTGLVKNAVNAKKKGMGFWKGAGSAIAGGASAAFRGGKAGLNATSFGDMKGATTKGIVASGKARDDRASRGARYKAKGQNWFTGHVADAKLAIKDWAGVDSLAGLKEKKSNYDQIMGYMSQLKKLAEGEASVQAYAGQLKALSETEIKRDDFYEEIEDATTGKRERVFNSAEYTKKLAEHAKLYEAAEKRYKIAIAKAIYDNRGKGNYQEIMEKFNTFRSEHMDDSVIAQMSAINSENIESQWEAMNGDHVLKTADDAAIEKLWSQMKETPGMFSWAYNDNEAKKESGRVSVEIAKKEAEERKKDS